MSYIKQYWLFFGTLFLGLVIWFFAFVCSPLKVVEPFKIDTILFIIASYMTLIIGFLSFKFERFVRYKQHFNNRKVLITLILIIILSYLLRWFDLFYIRELSFANEFKVNRDINYINYGKTNAILIIASILKSLYFFPFVIVASRKLSLSKLLTILSYAVLFFPLIEAALKGTRKPVFEIFFIILLALMLFQRHKLNIQNIFKLLFAFFVVITISLAVLVKREKTPTVDNTIFYNKMLDSRYNDMLKPKPFFNDYLNDATRPDILKLYALIFLQTGQYITHGVFEFNHIFDREELPITYGTYTFVAIPKFINKLGIFNKIEYSNPSPRKYVYLTAFGGLYIDFRWATLGIMFLFGVLQKYIYQKSKRSLIYTPILIYFLIINVFLLMINYISGAGIYPILSFFFLLLILRILGDNIYEKSIST